MPMPTRQMSAKTTHSTLDRHQAALARLLPLWPHELADTSPAGRERRLVLLRKALRAERRRGLAGHWTYDLGRHSALLACYRREASKAAGHSIGPSWSASGAVQNRFFDKTHDQTKA